MEILETLAGSVSWSTHEGSEVSILHPSHSFAHTHIAEHSFHSIMIMIVAGINEIVSTVQTKEILSSIAKMNEWYLNNASPEERQYTMYVPSCHCCLCHCLRSSLTQCLHNLFFFLQVP